MSVAKRIAKNAFLLTGGEIISRILFFLLSVLIARNLGAIGFGQYSFAFGFTVLFKILMDIGLSKLLTREVARDKSKIGFFFYNGLTLKVILTFISLSIIFLIVNSIPTLSDLRIIIYLAACYVAIDSFNLFFKYVFTAVEILKYEAFVLILEKVIIFFLGYFILMHQLGLVWLMIAYLVGGATRSIISFSIILIKLNPKFRIIPNSFIPLLKKAYPFSLSVLFLIIYGKIDITMLSFLKGNEVVGWYSAAYDILIAVMLLPSFLMNPIFPVMSQSFLKDKKILNKICQLTIKYFLLFSIPIVFGGIVLAKEIILFIYTKEFTNSILILQVLLLNLFFYALRRPLTGVLQASNKEKKVMYVYGTCAFVNIILNFLLIPILSGIGAAIATIFTEALNFILLYYLVIKTIDKIDIPKKMIKPIISAFLMSLVLFYIKGLVDLWIISLILLGAVIYLISFILIKGFNNEDIRILKKVLKVNTRS